MNSFEVAERIQVTCIIAILRKIKLEQAAPAIEVAVAAGLKAIEITLDGADALQTIEWCRDTFGKDILIGAGTVMNIQQIHSALDAGADVLFSPHFDEALMDEANQSGTLMIPGVMTPTEIVSAKRAGANIVKLFPAGPFGPMYLKDILGPLSGTRIIPTGGITPENALEYIRAGALAVGIGSSLITRADIERADWPGLKARIQQLLSAIGTL